VCFFENKLVTPVVGGWVGQRPNKGRQKQNRKKLPMHVRALFGLDFVLDVDFGGVFIVFLSSPYQETPKNAIQKIEKGTKNRRTTPKLFFPPVNVLETYSFVFPYFRTPLDEKPPKTH
jgi:hypothetical protein